MNPTYRKINTDFIKKDKDELTDVEWEKQKKINAKKRDEQMKGPEPPKPKSPSPPPEGPTDKRVEHPDDDEPDDQPGFQEQDDPDISEFDSQVDYDDYYDTTGEE